MSVPNIQSVKNYLLALQDSICASLEILEEEAVFVEDLWDRGGDTGGGRTRVLENGQTFEQGGVNFSHVRGG